MRQALSFKYVKGSGAEIGALQGPLPVSDEARVIYVDRMPVADLRKQYPELDKYDLTPVDVIDDGELLSSFEDNSLDFIIANHMLEHCENPIGALRSHFGKLKEGGIGYYAVPDKDHTFDCDRPLDTFDHLVLDDKLDPCGSREEHFREWVTYVDKKHGDDAAERIRQLLRINYSIHYHVWDYERLYDFMVRADHYLGNVFTVEEFARNGNEVICILRKGRDPHLEEKLSALPEGSGKALDPHGAVKDLEEQVAVLRATVTERDRLIAALLSSASWKATAFLRTIHRLAGSFWAYLKARQPKI